MTVINEHQRRGNILATLIGKTIASVRWADLYVTLTFTDGTSVEILAEGGDWTSINMSIPQPMKGEG